MVKVDLQNRKCPFCAEQIQFEAIKCRFCGEFIDNPAFDEQSASTQSENILYDGSPSMINALPAFLRALVLVAVAALILKLPIESMLYTLSQGHISEKLLAEMPRYRLGMGLSILLIAVVYVSTKIIAIRYTRYVITADRIEYSRGILDREVDNIDMFRVTDIKLRRNLLDYILATGTVTVITSEKTDPEFVFRKVPRSRKLYDAVKQASLDADKKQNVVHFE